MVAATTVLGLIAASAAYAAANPADSLIYYDSESKTVSAYRQWMQSSLAYYSANVAPATRIVPVLPSYSANRWHLPGVENVQAASAALADALGAGSRVNGAADRAAWLSTTVDLPFAP